MNQEITDKTSFKVFSTPEKAATVLADNIIDQTKKVIQEKGRCVWALSGGSSILKLYDALSNYEEFFHAFGNSLMITWVDERVVPHTHQKSNFGSAKSYFWEKFENIRLIPIPFEDTAEESANSFKSRLKKEKIQRGDVDIIILGMGSDGHTASLFPQNDMLEEMTKDIVPVADSSVDVERVSMTYPFINASSHIYLFFYGDEKGNTIREAIQSGNKSHYPIVAIDWEKTRVYTDQHI